MEIHAVVTDNLNPKILEASKKAKEEHDFGKTSEEWEAIEKAERRTIRGKIKYAWEDYIYYPTYRFFRRTGDIPSNIVAFWQRGRRGYADSDSWGIDNYLDSFMPELLRHMIDDKVGGGNSYPGHEGDLNCDTAEHWQNTVEKIAKGFEAGRKIDDLAYKNGKQYRAEHKKLEKQRVEGMKLFVKYYTHLWD